MNYKIRVNSEAESKEAQELFSALGGEVKLNDRFGMVCLTNGRIYVDDIKFFDEYDDCKELTIPQLRDVVVLKRNDVSDANYKSATDFYFVSSMNEYYFWNGYRWVESKIESIIGLDEIKKEMGVKELLLKLKDGSFVYSNSEMDSVPHYVEAIEIPEGADTLAGDSSTRYFWKHGVGEKGNMIIGVGESLARYSGWTDCKDSADVWLDCVNDDSFKIIWQRETLNDKVASAEVARQEFIGVPFSDLHEFDFGEVDDFVESNVEQGAKHSHYKKDISHLNTLDIYRVTELFNPHSCGAHIAKKAFYKKDISHLNTLDIYRVTELFNPHSCGAHIAKKALCSGQHGHKDLLTDIQDIIDTAERWKEMLIEDGNS